MKGIYYGRDGGKTRNVSVDRIGSKRVQLEGGWKVQYVRESFEWKAKMLNLLQHILKG